MRRKKRRKTEHNRKVFKTNKNFFLLLNDKLGIHLIMPFKRKHIVPKFIGGEFHCTALFHFRLLATLNLYFQILSSNIYALKQAY